MRNRRRVGDAARRRVWFLTAALTIVAAGFSVPFLDPSGIDGAQLASGAGLLVLFAAAEWFSLSIRIGDRVYNLTLSEFPLLLGLHLLSPALLLATRIVGMGIGLVGGQKQPAFKVGYNLAAAWLQALVALAAVTGLDPGRTLTGGSGFLAVLLMAVGITVTTALCLTAVISLHEGRLRPGLLLPFVREMIGPTVATTGFAVATLVLIRDSLWLIWVPAVILGVLLAAYRSNVQMAHINDRQSRLLEFTRSTTGREGVQAAAEKVVQATAELPGILAAGIARHDGADDIRWVAGHVDLGPMTRLAIPADVEGGGPAASEVDGRTTLTWALDEAGTALVVQVDPAAARGDDLRRTVDQVANHARVAIANATHGEALVEQARTAAARALTDPLTGLPNRTAITHAITAALGGGSPFAVVLIDLDDFKEINDALGHTAGDAVLREIGLRLQDLPDPDVRLARLGGDEFAAVVPGGEATARAVAERLLQLIAAPVALASYRLEVGASLGIALHPEHASSADELLTFADLSMYQAKADGGGIAVFGSDAADKAVRHLAVSSTLRAGLAQRQIRPVYQPQIDLRTERLVGVEALARWVHPELGPIRPEEFVRVAEQSGLLQELTDAILEDALRWQARWAAEGFDLQVAVNLSPRSLMDVDLPRRLARALDRHGVAADRLTIEITEGSVMTDPGRTRAVLGRVQALGIKVALDDFGTGYSSLAYLQEVPADVVKIDKSFVLPMAGRKEALPLVSGIIRLCHELGFVVVAEGIEQPEVQATLRGLGCDRGQGFAIARPMAAEDITTWAVAHRDRWTIAPTDR